MLSAGSFRAPKPLRVQCQTCLMNCSRARSTCFVERNRIRARRRSSIGWSKTPLPESPKRRKDLFCRLKWDCFLWASSVLLMGIPKACSPRHYEYTGLSAKSSQALRTACSACHGCGTRRAQPLAELSLAERSEASAVNRALRARIRRKLEAIKKEAIQLPRISCLGRRESVLSTYGIIIKPVSADLSRCV